MLEVDQEQLQILVCVILFFFFFLALKSHPEVGVRFIKLTFLHQCQPGN